MYQIPRIFEEAHKKGFSGFRLVRNPRVLHDPRGSCRTVQPGKYTHHTIINGRTPRAEKGMSWGQIQERVWLAEDVFQLARTWEYAAVIGGMPVILRTNSAHLANFWSRNWWQVDPAEVYEAQKRYGIPVVVMRAAIGSRDPQPDLAEAFYSRETNETVFWDTDYYGQCKSWALGAAGVELATHEVQSIHGACVEIDGSSFKKRGILLVAPTGTGKSTYTNVLARVHEIDPRYRGRINSDDWVYVKDGVAMPSERFIYVRTNAVDDTVPQDELSDTMRMMKAIFDKAPCENVPLSDAGRRLYGAVPNSRAIINPSLLSPMTYATSIRLVVLLRRDNESPFFEELDAARAVAILEEGRYMVQPGAGPKALWGTMQKEPWYNPYLLAPNPAFERRKFAELKEKYGARFVIFNTSTSVAPREFGIQKPPEEITSHDIEKTVEGTARLMLELLN